MNNSIDIGGANYYTNGGLGGGNRFKESPGAAYASSTTALNRNVDKQPIEINLGPSRATPMGHHNKMPGGMTGGLPYN